MNRIFKAVEGKDDITTNFILKFENENTVKLFDFISFENFEPAQITCLGVRNTADKQIQILDQLLKNGARPVSILISGKDASENIPKDKASTVIQNVLFEEDEDFYSMMRVVAQQPQITI